MLLTLIASAFAQDASGALVNPGDGSPDAPSFGTDPSPPAGGEWLVGLGASYADATFRRYACDPDCEPELVVGRLVGTNLAAAFGFTDHVGISVQAPLFLATSGVGGAGPAFGDVRLAFPIVAARTETANLTIVPAAALPTGASARFLGESRVVPSLEAAAGASLGPLALGIDAGVRLGAPALEHPAGLDLLGAASARWTPADTFAIGPEARVLRSSSADVRGTTVEAGVSLRGRAGSFAWTAGATHGLSSGLGTAAWRGFAGASWAPRAGPDLVAESETVEIYAVDPRSVPVRGAKVRVGSVIVGTTDADGHFAMPKGTRWRDHVFVEQPGLASIEVFHPASPALRADVAMRWAPVGVEAEVVDAAGRPITAATIRLSGSSDPGAPLLQEGRYLWTVPPGTYTFEAAGPGFGTQRRQLLVAPGRTATVELEAVLYPVEGDGKLTIRAHDPYGGAVQDAVVTVDGRLIGTSAHEGTVEIEGLAPGHHDLKLLSDHLEITQTRTVAVTKDTPPVDLTMGWRDGTIRVIAKGPEGQAIDAVAAFRGPAEIRPTPLGEDGQREFVLGPGTWQVLVSSPTLGLQVREVEVAAVTGPPIDVVVTLQPEGSGRGELLVKVISVDGQPIEGAEIVVDGRSFGQTANRGDLLISTLDVGDRTIEVRGPPHAVPASLHATVQEGFQEFLVPLDFEPGSLEIVAHTVSGEPVDAQVRLSGPTDFPPLHLGPRGTTRVVVGPGEWSMLASSITHGLQSRDIVIEPGTAANRVEFVLNDVAKADATLRVVVTGPDGQPLEGATVVFGKTSLGTTSSGGTLTASGLPAVTAGVTVEAPGCAPSALPPVRLTSRGTTTQLVKLAWAPGATRVVVTGPNGRVQDAMVRAASSTGVIPPRTVGSDGSVVLALTPGTWQVLVSSSHLGLVQRDIVVAADSKALQEETFVFSAQEAATADLLVRVFDPDHHAVALATVTIAGKAAGTTSAGGSMMIPGLPPGRVDAVVSAPYMESAVFELDLEEGVPATEFVTLQWQPVVASISTRDGAGSAIAATLSATSQGRQREVVQTGADGLGALELRPGWWTVFAEAPGFGVRRTDLVLAPGTAPRDITFVLSKARTDISADQLRILDKVEFDLDQTDLGENEAEALAEIATLLLAHPEITRLEVQGHSDLSGTPAYNMDLSQQRADTVRMALIDLGVPAQRLASRGYGAMRPIADNETDQGRAKNRRVEFAVRETASEP